MFESPIISTKIIFQIGSLLKQNKTKQTKIGLRSDVIVRLAIHMECNSTIMNLVTEAKT